MCMIIMCLCYLKYTQNTINNFNTKNVSIIIAIYVATVLISHLPSVP